MVGYLSCPPCSSRCSVCLSLFFTPALLLSLRMLPGSVRRFYCRHCRTTRLRRPQCRLARTRPRLRPRQRPQQPRWGSRRQPMLQRRLRLEARGNSECAKVGCVVNSGFDVVFAALHHRRLGFGPLCRFGPGCTSAQVKSHVWVSQVNIFSPNDTPPTTNVPLRSTGTQVEGDTGFLKCANKAQIALWWSLGNTKALQTTRSPVNWGHF